MLQQVDFYWKFEGKEYRITVDGKGFNFILKNIKDLNALVDFLDISATWKILGPVGYEDYQSSRGKAK